MKPKTLLIATTSYAGMGPYVIAMINSLARESNIGFIVVEREDRYFSRNIHKDVKNKGIIIREKTPSKLTVLYNLLIDNRYTYDNIIIDYCKREKVEIVHALTSLSDQFLVKYLVSNYKLLYTIHDLYPHEAKKKFYKMWRQNILYKRIFGAIEMVNYLYTNSKLQLQLQQTKYPDKTSFYSPFPTLVTDEVAKGSEVPKELAQIDNYILFFGRLEAYKGLSLLIQSFMDANIPNTKLVIAGKGDIELPVKNKNIITINRYIDDKEIASLYRRARCVVYPYLSITQSGVLSVALYFGIPIIASDLPFFKEILGENYMGLFPSANGEALKDKLKIFCCETSTDMSELSKTMRATYYDIYSRSEQGYQLNKIYEYIKRGKAND